MPKNFDISKDLLMSLVEAYRSRKYDEDLQALQHTFEDGVKTIA